MADEHELLLVDGSQSWLRSTTARFSSVLPWLSFALVGDWIVVLVIQLFERQVRASAVHEEDVKLYLDDPSIMYRHTDKETIPGSLNDLLTYSLPLLLLVLISAARLSLFELHQSLLAFVAGSQANQLATDFVKSRVGRLRPDFLARCQFDFELNECTGDVRIVQEGRKSFPSGHSSQAFYGMIFLSLYLAGKNRAWSLEHTDSHTHLVRSRLYRSAVVIAPIFLSTYIAISRWDDHVHHPTDILAGCLLGTAIALSNYLIWWPSPFGSRNHVTMPTPRLHYAKPVVEREPADEQV